MTRKDFEALAEALASVRPAGNSGAALTQWSKTVTAIAKVCAESNGRFDVAKFRLATHAPLDT